MTPKTPEKLIACHRARITRLNTRIKKLQDKRDTEQKALEALRANQVVLKKRPPEWKFNHLDEKPLTGWVPFEDVKIIYARTNPKDWDGSLDALRALYEEKCE
jgi:hypothetical protein